MRRKFLWGDVRLEKKPQLLRHVIMCLNKEHGCLGVKDLGCLNKALEWGLPLTNRCYLCHEKEETLDHPLLHCVKTRSLWELIFSLLGLHGRTRFQIVTLF